MELYIHIPFCVKKCDYCDFLSFPCCNGHDHEKYIKALIRELEQVSGLPSLHVIKTCFIGGGTPSIISPEIFEKLLICIKKNFVFEKDYEFTIECNPGTLTEKKLKLYRNYGINRLSIGLQSDRDESLKKLGRIHDYADFLESYVLARRAGFTNINIDLMSAIPGQNVEKWRHTLENVCRLKPEHISAYSLIIEEGTPLYEAYNKDSKSLQLAGEDEEREMYHVTAQILQKFGYQRYEISNYAKSDYECRHNLGYWTGEPYYGAGVGASSYLSEGDFNKIAECYGAAKGTVSESESENTNNNIMKNSNMVRFKNTSDLSKYIIMNGQCFQNEETEYLGKEDLMSEYCILGLRTCRGISAEEFEKRFGEKLDEIYGCIIEKYMKMGFLERDGERIRFTEKGFDVSNSILCDFV